MPIFDSIQSFIPDICRGLFTCTLPALTRQGTVTNAIYYGLPNKTWSVGNNYSPITNVNSLLNAHTGRSY